MHNCKTTGESLTECSECREEHTLLLTTRVIEAAAPPDNYWPHYHAKLRRKLIEARVSNVATEPSAGSSSWITNFFRSSVSVPVPVGLALMFGVALLLVYGIRTSRPIEPTQKIVHVPIEVPVVQEKIVTRVVYRQRQLAPSRAKQTPAAPPNGSTFAKTQNPTSLIGFKPSEEVKLTVIKGGAPK